MCQHCHENHEEKRPIERIFLKIVLPVLILFSVMFFNIPHHIATALYICAYLLAGYSVLLTAFKNILKGDFFDENFLMSVATLGAILIKEYPEAVMVMVLYGIGETLQDRAVDKSKNSISKLIDIKPKYANVCIGDEIQKKDPNEVKIGDIVIVKTGEKIPLDGVIEEGEANVDTSALTGESLPLFLEKNKQALNGCIVNSGYLKIRVTKLYSDSTVAKILELVEYANKKKANSEKFITKFAKIYTPIVVVLALILAILPPLIFGSDINVWLNRALIFLVISCPCALVLSVPLSFFAGIGAAAKQGILIKGSKYIEILAKIKNVIFDKTGTLTKGCFEIEKIVTKDNSISKKEILDTISQIESYSNHPLALSILKSYDGVLEKKEVKNLVEISGKGLKATIDNQEVLVGNVELLKMNNINISISPEEKTTVFLAINSEYKGYIVLSDSLKDYSKIGIDRLKKMNINTFILSGDNKKAVEKIADELGVNNYFSKLLPQDKVEKIEEIIKTENKNQKTAFVGDGINDAPVLKRADVGISMGVLGSDIAIEASDVVIMDDNLAKISKAIDISKKTLSIVKQNIIFAIFVKILFLVLSMLGMMTMWFAVFADVGVTFLAVLNCLRIIR